MMVLCSIFAVVTNIIANRMASRVARDTTRRIRHDLFFKITSLSSRQVDQATIPSLESRLTADTYYVHQMVSMMQRMGVRAPILLIGGLIVTFMLEPVLTLVLAAVTPLIAFVVYCISKRGIPLYTQTQRAVDKMVSAVRENATGVRVIKALSKGDYEKARFDAANREVVERETKASVTMAASNPLMNLLLNVGLVLVIVVGAFRVDAGLILPGKIIAFLSYFTIILNAMLSITRIFVMVSRGVASAGRINEILEMEEDLRLLPAGRKAEGCHICFDHVSFSYNGVSPNVEDLSFCLEQGQTLGIIGATGSGKTTVINLLMRFYDPDEGQIRIHGEDVRSIPLERLRPMFGVVFQNDTLFAESIGENIDFGRGLTEARIAEAAADAQAAGFIEELGEGYDYLLTARGTNLSGGQKQRLLVARALAAKPEILILDDSSSALDYKTDARLRGAIRQNYAGVTTIIVAQRVSSILQADHILVLEAGRVIGSGTHEELLMGCESYRAISESQMGGAEIA